MNLVIKDAVRQILGRVASALGGFIVIKLITPYLGPLRFGDYSTILKYFAIWSAFADFGLYVIALKQLGIIKKDNPEQLEQTYGKFVSTRGMMILLIYSFALVIAYFIPAYTSNPYLIRGLPLGMLFSASFMAAGILQIPLQLYWKMEQLSIGLILARIVQIGLLAATIYWFYPIIQGETASRQAFLRIIGSVLASGVVQGLYVRWQGKKFLPLKWTWDWTFTKKLLKGNWQYGFAYYLSSFHTLVVLILLSRLYPTTQGYTYVGIWALALSLIEILLIVPSALGNSLIHKVSASTTEEKRIHFGHLCTIVTWIGGIVIILFSLFAPHVIGFIGGSDYLTTAGSLGSDWLLPWLGIIVTLSFIKQVHNYLFVSTGHQNTLLGINLVGVIIGLSLAVPLIQKYQLVGGLIAQGILECLFVAGALYVARKNKILLKIIKRDYIIIISSLVLFLVVFPKSLFSGSEEQLLLWIIQGFLITLLLTGASYKLLKRNAKGL